MTNADTSNKYTDPKLYGGQIKETFGNIIGDDGMAQDGNDKKARAEHPNPSVIKGNANFIAGQVKETIGHWTGSDDWKEAGKEQKRDGEKELQATRELVNEHKEKAKNDADNRLNNNSTMIESH